MLAFKKNRMKNKNEMQNYLEMSKWSIPPKHNDSYSVASTDGIMS